VLGAAQAGALLPLQLILLLCVDMVVKHGGGADGQTASRGSRRRRPKNDSFSKENAAEQGRPKTAEHDARQTQCKTGIRSGSGASISFVLLFTCLAQSLSQRWELGSCVRV
jgi:hypothetical protein